MLTFVLKKKKSKWKKENGMGLGLFSVNCDAKETCHYVLGLIFSMITDKHRSFK